MNSWTAGKDWSQQATWLQNSVMIQAPSLQTPRDSCKVGLRTGTFVTRTLRVNMK